MRTLFLCVASFSIIALTDAQLIRQCTCQEIESCKQKYFNSVKPCTDRCQKYAAALKADYKILKGCILQREDMMRRTVECTQAAFPNACARTPGKFVPKRHLESIEIAGVAEINRMLSTTGVSEQVQGLLAQGRKFLRCTKSCLDRSASQCADKLKCGFDLPSDNVLVQTSKQCAIRSGFNTRIIQDMCRCFVGAGLRQLVNVCPRLQVN